jgi:hypothetical protein
MVYIAVKCSRECGVLEATDGKLNRLFQGVTIFTLHVVFTCI